VRDLGHRARQLDAGRPPADDHERQRRAPLGLVVGALRDLEREQEAPPDLGRVLDGLEPGGEALPLRMPEVAVRRARCQDEPVEAHVLAVDDEHAVGEPDRRRLAEQDLGVALRAQHLADRRCDVGRAERSGRDLVEQRLEQVVVAAIDDQHVDRRATQRPRRFETAEAGADDHDARSGCVHLEPSPPVAAHSCTRAPPSSASPDGSASADRDGRSMWSSRGDGIASRVGADCRAWPPGVQTNRSDCVRHDTPGERSTGADGSAEASPSARMLRR
jgi:hypothetical protein